jgi:hypothetical protein
VAGLLPRAGPSAGAMQLPLLTAFAYSAAFSLAVASVSAPLVLGAAAGLGGVAEALRDVDGSAADAARTAELRLVRFRV